MTEPVLMREPPTEMGMISYVPVPTVAWLYLSAKLRMGLQHYPNVWQRFWLNLIFGWTCDRATKDEIKRYGGR